MRGVSLHGLFWHTKGKGCQDKGGALLSVTSAYFFILSRFLALGAGSLLQQLPALSSPPRPGPRLRRVAALRLLAAWGGGPPPAPLLPLRDMQGAPGRPFLGPSGAAHPAAVPPEGTGDTRAVTAMACPLGRVGPAHCTSPGNGGCSWRDRVAKRG